MKILLALVVVSSVVSSGLSTRAEPLQSGYVSDRDLDVRVLEFAGEIRCLVCQNESVADSRSDLAVDLRAQIREQMRAGRSENEIARFLTERYGDFVLYRPPLRPTTYLLWFGPFLMLATGFFVLYRRVKSSSAGSGDPGS